MESERQNKGIDDRLMRECPTVLLEAPGPAALLKRVKELFVVTDLPLPSGTDVRLIEER